MPKRDPKTGKFVKSTTTRRKKSKASISMCGKKHASGSSSVSTLTKNEKLRVKALMGICRASPAQLEQIVDALPAVKDEVTVSFLGDFARAFAAAIKSYGPRGFAASMNAASGNSVKSIQAAGNAGKQERLLNKFLKNYENAKKTADANQKSRDMQKKFDDNLKAREFKRSRVIPPKVMSQLV